MTKKKIALALLFLFSLGSVQGQELVKRKKEKDSITEEFYALKEDKDIKHGSALTTYKDILDKKYIVEYGQYDQSKKSGEWLTFYYVDPSNPLKSIGSYTNDLKQGEWRYYYPGSPSTNSIQTLFGGEKRTNIIPGTKDAKMFRIEYDTIGQKMICTGKYNDDKKIGIWNYYSQSGYLLQRYDHDGNAFMENYLRDSDNDFLIYLGGAERFSNYFRMGQQELKYREPIAKTSEVIFEVQKNGSYKVVSSYGDPVHRKQTEKVLETIPNDWIPLNGDAQKKLQLVSRIEVTENTFNKYKFLLEFKVVE